MATVEGPFGFAVADYEDAGGRHLGGVGVGLVGCGEGRFSMVVGVKGR